MPIRLNVKTVLSLALALAACGKDVKQQQPVESFALAAIDPGQAGVRAATIPLPNDLALQAAPSQTGVTREVLFSFIQAGGFPGDQTITVPFRTATRDPSNGTYVTGPTPPALDPATVTAQTVAIVRVSDSPPTVLAPEFVGYAADPANPAVGVLRLRPTGGLLPGRYVVAVRGGPSGVKTTAGGTVGADQAIALVAPDKDLSNPENQPPGGLDPVTQLPALEGTATTPGLRDLYHTGFDWSPVPNEQVCRAALRIPAAVPFPEGVCWLPTNPAGASPGFGAVDQVFPHQEIASIQAFEIAATAVVADTTTGVIPFPSDFLLGADGKVRNIPSLGPAAPGLATLDGFSTTSLLLVPLSAPVQADTITRANVLLFELGAGPPRQLADLTGGGIPEYVTQPPNLVQTVNGTKVSSAIGLQPAVPVQNGDTVVSLPPLKPKTRYLVAVTDGVKDVTNTPLTRGTLATLLFTVQAPLFDGTHSTVPGVSDTDAQGLQAIRTALRPAVQLIETSTGKKVAMAYTVTTQDVKKVSGDLTALPYNVEAAAGGPFFTASGVADFDPTAAPFNLPAAAFGNVAKFVTANVATLDALSASTGALDPNVATWGPAQFAANRHDIPALVAIPKVAATCTPSAPCPKPLLVFHHGLNGGHFQMLAAADAFAAKGFVVAAIDAPFHGDRAFCSTNADCNGGTCTPQPDNQKAPGVCTGGSGLAFDAARLTTVASGNYFISENFFRIRDAIRQDLLDHSALVLAAARPPSATPDALGQALVAAGIVVNPQQVYFTGLSLGGMIGTSLVATNPRISRAGLNVAGGTLVDVFTNAPAFRTEVAALLANLIPGFTFEKVDPTNPAFDPAIAQRYAQTLIVAKWVLDPADPVNYAADLTTKDAANAALRTALGPLAVTSADAYGQMIEGDTVVPNPFNVLLYANASIPVAIYTTTAIPAENRHGLLLGPNAQGARIRADLASFLADPTTPATGTIALP